MYSFPGGSSDKEPACQCKRHRQETQVQYLGWEDPLKEEMAPHSSIFVWKTPWTEEPARLQSMESQKVWHNWVRTYPPPAPRHTHLRFMNVEVIWNEFLNTSKCFEKLSQLWKLSKLSQCFEILNWPYRTIKQTNDVFSKIYVWH